MSKRLWTAITIVIVILLASTMVAVSSGHWGTVLIFIGLGSIGTLIIHKLDEMTLKIISRVGQSGELVAARVDRMGIEIVDATTSLRAEIGSANKRLDLLGKNTLKHSTTLRNEIGSANKRLDTLGKNTLKHTTTLRNEIGSANKRLDLLGKNAAKQATVSRNETHRMIQATQANLLGELKRFQKLNLESLQSENRGDQETKYDSHSLALVEFLARVLTLPELNTHHGTRPQWASIFAFTEYYGISNVYRMGKIDAALSDFPYDVKSMESSDNFDFKPSSIVVLDEAQSTDQSVLDKFTNERNTAIAILGNPTDLHIPAGYARVFGNLVSYDVAFAYPAHLVSEDLAVNEK